MLVGLLLINRQFNISRYIYKLQCICQLIVVRKPGTIGGKIKLTSMRSSNMLMADKIYFPRTLRIIVLNVIRFSIRM
jgi:hypothetical protein